MAYSVPLTIALLPDLSSVFPPLDYYYFICIMAHFFSGFLNALMDTHINPRKF